MKTAIFAITGFIGIALLAAAIGCMCSLFICYMLDRHWWSGSFWNYTKWFFGGR